MPSTVVNSSEAHSIRGTGQQLLASDGAQHQETRVIAIEGERSPESTTTKRWATSNAVIAISMFMGLLCLTLYLRHLPARDMGGESLKLNKEQELQNAVTEADAECGLHRGEVGSSRSWGSDSDAGGPPYLYVTFHGGLRKNRIRNVCKYSRTGTPLGAVLQPHAGLETRNLRGMLLLGHDLLVAEAHSKTSKLLVYGKCDGAIGGRREMKEVLVAFSANNTGLVHPYGLAQSTGENATRKYLFVSVQGRSEVLRYDLRDGQPARLPSAMSNALNGETATDSGPTSEAHVNDIRSPLDNGTFIQFPSDNRVRDIVEAEGHLFVADEDLGVLEYNSDGFLLGRSLPVASAVSLYFCPHRHSLWASSRRHHSVVEFDLASRREVKRIKHRYLKHPTGIAGDEKTLYVLSQATGSILQFEKVSGRLIKVLNNRLSDAAERLVMSPC